MLKFHRNYKIINMDDKKAAQVLMGLLGKYSLNIEEKEALREAIGILSWTSLSKSRLKAKKDKLERDAKW